MEKESEFIVNGFLFGSTEEAQEAEKESRKIQYLESKMDYGDLPKVRAIYEKAVKEEVFRTAVGLFYLKGLRDFLVREGEEPEEALPRVPAPARNAGSASKSVETAEKKRDQRQERRQAEKDYRFRVSVILNVLLIVAILAMFIITLDADQPNILNYERAITDKYASWEQELTQREQAVKEKELELFREE